MTIKIKSKFSELLLWCLIAVSLPWYIFAVTLLLNPFGFIPIVLIIVAASSLYLKHSFLKPALQLWAIYLIFNSGIKLLGMYLESIGAITYDGSSFSAFRHGLFFTMAFYLFYYSVFLIDEWDQKKDQ